LFSLPAGWLADRWSRRNMMAAFYFGCGLSLVGAALAPSLWMLAAALFALGVFAAIYHPVGTAMLIETATQRGRSLAFNGVCGNLGVSLAAGITAALTAAFSWRGAFLVPGLIAIATGAAYVWLAPDEERHASKRSSAPDVALSMPAAVAIFALFMVVALTAGLVFNTLTVALPKIVDERIGGDVPLVVVGGLSTAVFLCGGLAQIAVGRLVERFPPNLLFAAIALIQFAGVAWAVRATGTTLLVALAVTMAAIYGQITVNDLVIARYTADAWRGRVYVLSVTAAVALALFVAVVFIAVIANGVEKTRVPHPVPAE
jgi:MFS family permease